MGNPVVHFEIGCRDREKTVEFYSKMFDWKFSPMGPATMVSTGGMGLTGISLLWGMSRISTRSSTFRWRTLRRR